MSRSIFICLFSGRHPVGGKSGSPKSAGLCRAPGGSAPAAAAAERNAGDAAGMERGRDRVAMETKLDA